MNQVSRLIDCKKSILAVCNMVVLMYDSKMNVVSLTNIDIIVGSQGIAAHL